MSKFAVLKKRKDFLRAAKDVTMVSHNVMLQAAHVLSDTTETRPARIGFTATKRLGKANVRNRTKRRLRAAVREIYDTFTLPNVDYVLVGRLSTATCPFAELLRDAKYVFKKANKQILENTTQIDTESNKDVEKTTDSAD